MKGSGAFCPSVQYPQSVESACVGRDSNPRPLECDVEKCWAIFCDFVFFRRGMELAAPSLGEVRDLVCNGQFVLHPYIFNCTSCHYINIVTAAILWTQPVSRMAELIQSQVVPLRRIHELFLPLTRLPHSVANGQIMRRDKFVHFEVTFGLPRDTELRSQDPGM
jgi:hypothetical protein